MPLNRRYSCTFCRSITAYDNILKTWALAVHVPNAHPNPQTTQLVKNLQALQTNGLCALTLEAGEE